MLELVIWQFESKYIVKKNNMLVLKDVVEVVRFELHSLVVSERLLRLSNNLNVALDREY